MEESMEQFKQPDNLNMIWEVLLDELHIDQENDPVVRNVGSIFQANINMFLIKTNMTLPIIELNKLFLSQVVAAVNKMMPDLKQRKKIKILEDYKIEDIQTSRQKQLEQEFKIKQLEMEQYLIPQKPQEPQFADVIDNQTESQSVEYLLAEKMAERNNEWMPSPSLPPPPMNAQKKVTWASDEKTGIMDNLLSKLKKTETSIDDKYEQQESVSLDHIASPHLPLPNVSASTTNTNVPPMMSQMLPMSEMVKLMNEINRKLDLLLERMSSPSSSTNNL